MRVISGTARATHLEAPEGDSTRPTTDRIKETLFNMISFDMPQCELLDLFSGSGAISIECLSRGGSRAVLVEKDKKAIEIIKKNLDRTHLKDKAVIIEMDVINALDNLEGNKFDIVFMDPPYSLANIEIILQKIVNNDFLAENGYIILERSTNTIVKLPQNLVLWKEKKYKTTTLSFIRKG